MTIRDWLWKRTIRNHLLWVFICAAAFSLMAWLPNSFSQFAVAALVILSIAIPYGILMAGIACPACKFAFIKIGFMRIKLGGEKFRINHCPHCGIGLDSAVDSNCSIKPTR